MNNKKLKVLFTNDSPLIKFGLKSGFDNLGHETMLMTDRYRLWDKPKERQVELFKEAIEFYSPDLVISECFANFAEGIFEHTQEKGVFHALWSIEDTPFDHWIGDYWCKYADHVFTTTAECLMNYWNKGIKADLLPFGVNKDFHRRQAINPELQQDIVLVGSNYERREHIAQEFLTPIIQKGYDFGVYGNSWWTDNDRKFNLSDTPHIYKGILPYEQLSVLYSSSKVAIGMNCDDQSFTQCSMRMWEVLGTGGALLVSPYTKAQEFLFGEHIYLPKTSDEMIESIEEIFRMSESERYRKATGAQNFVYKYHNYDIRASKVIDAYFCR